MNKKMIRYIVGSIIMLEAALLLLPILTAIVYGEWNTLRVFAGSALFCIVAGALLRGKKPENTTIFSVEGYVSVALCWVALSICGAIPLCVSGVLQNPFDAFFEIVSGFTTTGSSVMQRVRQERFLCGEAFLTGLAVWEYWYLCWHFFLWQDPPVCI